MKNSVKKMLTITLSLLVQQMCPVPRVFAASENYEMVVPSSTKIPIILQSSLNGFDVKEGQLMKAKVKDNIVVDHEVCIAKGSEIVGQVTNVDRSGGGESCRLTFDKLVLPNQSVEISVSPIIKGGRLTILREGQPIFLDCSTRTSWSKITNICSRKGKSFSLFVNDEMTLSVCDSIRIPSKQVQPSSGDCW